MRDLIGQQLGDYELVSLIGRSGFAEVYLGQHVQFSTQVAIKVLHTHLSPAKIKEFVQEAEMIASLVHSHIVRILDSGVSNGIPFLVMEYCSHGSLRQYHPKGERLPLSTVVSYITQIADALQYAHSQKHIHHNVKPENMFIGQHDAILLSDFGIAATAHSTFFMNKQTFVGTPAYMAPEQIKLHRRRESDQYALAIVTYEWLAGKLPFLGTPEEIATKHLSVEPPSLHQKLPNLPISVEEVVFKALAKEPKERFPSVQDFATALQHASQRKLSISSSPEPNTTSSRLTQPPVLTPPAVPAFIEDAGTPNVLPITMNIAASNINSEPEEIDSSTTTVIADINTHLEPEAAVAPSMTETGILTESDTATEPKTMAIPQPATMLSLDPEQPSSSYSTPWQKLTRRQVLIGLATTAIVGGTIWEIANLRLTPSNPHRYTYTGHSWTVYTIAWSPDGKRIASGASDNTVQVWDATNGDNAYSYQEHSDTVYSVAWSPDGKHIASGSNDQTVQVWNAANGGNAYSYHGHSGTVYSVAWSPDGKLIASASADKTVQVWNATDGSQIYIYQGHSGQVYSVAWSPDGKRIASGGRDDTVQVWDATTGSNVNTYHGHSDAVNSVAWSPDGKHIASGSYDHTVRIWIPTIEGNVYIYQGHSNVVNAVAWSFDHQHIASASNDKTVQVWNATDGSNAYTYHGHTNIVETVAWSPDKQLIASGSWDGTVQVWQAP